MFNLSLICKNYYKLSYDFAGKVKVVKEAFKKKNIEINSEQL